MIFATSSSIGTPKKIIRSIIRRLNTSIDATLSFLSSMIVGLMYASIEAVLGAILLFSAIFLFRYFYTNGLSEQDDVKKIVIVILSLVGYLIVYTLIRNFMIGL